MSNLTIVDEDGRSLVEEEPKPKRKRKSKQQAAPAIQFPLPPKFTGPLKIYLFDGPDDPHERDAYIRKVWNYSGPPRCNLYKDTGWTTDDVIGSDWMMQRMGIYTITGFQASKWGDPELLCELHRADTRQPFSSHANSTITDMEGNIHWMLDGAIFIDKMMRFDIMPTDLQHRWLQAWVEAEETDYQRKKREGWDKYGIAWALEDTTYARKVLHDFEQQHEMRPTYQRLQREQPEKPRRKRMTVSPELQPSLFA